MDIENTTDANTLRQLPVQDDDCVEVGQFVQGNPQLPSRHTKIRFTPEMMREIKHCKEDIIHFAQNYFYIINLDKGRMCIDLYPVQKKMLRMMVDNNRFAACTSRQYGKCVCNNTKIVVKYKPFDISFNIRIGTFYKIQKILKKLSFSFLCNDFTLDSTKINLSPSIKKFTDVISLKNWQVETEVGWEDISSINKTIPYQKYTIKTESGKTLDCADNHIIMDKDGNQVFAKDSLGIEVKTKDGPEKITSVVDTGIEEEMFDLTLPEGSTHCYYTNEILSHNTTLLTIFALWYTTFQNDKTVLIVANKEEIALEILNRIRLAYEELPIWLKPGVKEYQKQSIVFLNGSKIKISATSTSAGRGLSINCLIVDECAIIDPFKSSEFFKSVLPTISSSKQAKILLTSTPKGTNNFFYRVIREAMTGKSAWKYMSVPWNMIPYRDEEWKQTAISDCGGDMQLFRQEYCCEFIEEGDSAIDKAVLDAMHMETYEPQVLNTNEYKVWHMPDPSHIYSIGVDVSDGVGGCASCIQVTDITNLREIHQVACYNNRYIDPAHFAIELYEIACQWGRPWILCERNSMGCETIATLEREPFFYPRLVSYDGKDKIDYSKHGIMSSTNVKFDGISNLRYYMNVLKVLKIPDADTMAEFDTFIKYPNGTYKKASGANIFDDRVMALVWSLFILWIPIAEACLCVTETDTAGKPLKVEKTYDDSGKDLYNLVGGMIPPDPKPTKQAPVYGGYIPYSADFNEDNMTMNDLMEAGWSPL